MRIFSLLGSLVAAATLHAASEPEQSPVGEENLENVATVSPSVPSAGLTTNASALSKILGTFEERKKAVLEGYARSGKDRFVKAQCLFELGRKEEALKEVNQALDTLVPGNKVNRWMHGGNTGFTVWPGLDCYIRYEKFLDPATRERYRKIYTGGVFYARLSTSNHKLMAATTRYLATQIWGADSFHADPWFMENDPYIQHMSARINKPGEVWGTSFAPGDLTGEKYLKSIIAATVRGGPGEYASRPYGAQNILPILSIADCAKDPVLRNSSRIAYEVCLIQLAPAWLRGHLATFAPRSYPDTECQKPWGVATLPWLYFGGVAPDLDKATAAARAATDPYQLSSVILPAGTDRSFAYSYRSLINGWALNHFVNRSYALFSRSAKVGGRPWQGQSYPCGVMWEVDPSLGSHLWITNPATDEPGKMGIHTHGVRPFEQEVLGRDSMLFVFNIGKENPFPYALGYIPGGYRAMINEAAQNGRIFLHYGTVLLAVTATQPFVWNPAGGILAQASKARAGDSEFRVKAAVSALAIETGLPAEFPGSTPEEQLRNFKTALDAKSSLQLTATNPPTGLYTNRHGDTLESTFNGLDKINGVIVDYKNWPVLESPWTEQKIPDGPLEVSDGKIVKTYNFKNWSVSEHTK